MTVFNRRDFLKSVSLIGLGATITLYTADIKKVLAQATTQVEAGVTNVVWLNGAACTGCVISLLQGVSPDLIEAIQKFKLAVDYQSTIMVESGDAAMAKLSGPVDVFIMEGAVPMGDRANAGTIGEVQGKPKTIYDWVMEISPKAKYILAVGTCAAFGGIPAGAPNPTNCADILDVVRPEDRAKIINIPGCPPHPDWMLSTIVSALQGWPIPLDDQRRPTAFFGHTIHDTCPRRGYYDEGSFKEMFGQEYLTDTCLLHLGCRGPITFADCSYRKWNSGLNMCTLSGAPCIGCCSPDFPDPPTSPFYAEYKPLTSVPPILPTVKMEDLATGIGVSVAAGVVAYGATRMLAGKSDVGAHKSDADVSKSEAKARKSDAEHK